MAHIRHHQQQMHNFHMQNQHRIHQQTHTNIMNHHNNFHRQQIHNIHQQNHQRHMQFHRDQTHRMQQQMHQQHHQRMRDESDRHRRMMDDDRRRREEQMRRMHSSTSSSSSSFGSRPGSFYYTINGEQGDLSESLLSGEGGEFTINIGGAPSPLIQKDEGTGNLILQEATFATSLQYYILCVVAISFIWFPIVSLIAFFVICTLEHKWIVFDKQQRAIVLYTKKLLGSRTYEKKRVPFEDLEAIQLAAQGTGFTDLLVKTKNQQKSLLLYTDLHYSQQQRLEQLQEWFDDLNGVKRQQEEHKTEGQAPTPPPAATQHQHPDEKSDTERHQQPSAPPPPPHEQ